MCRIIFKIAIILLNNRDFKSFFGIIHHHVFQLNIQQIDKVRLVLDRGDKYLKSAYKRKQFT